MRADPLRAIQVGAILLAFVTAAGPLAGQSRYVFPVAADPGMLTWEEPHWDGTFAVDIGIHSGFGIDAPERARFYAAQTVAVTDGRASRLDNPRGGIAVVVHGDDNRTYYYAHLSEATIEEPRRVRAGDPLGRIGNTGTWSQYLEPHLHLSIATGHQEGTDWVADVPAAAWLERTFGGTSVRVRPDAYPVDRPAGLPVFARVRVIEGFAERLAREPLLAGLTLEAAASASRSRLALRSPLTGVARVHLDTPLGVRVQISNSRGGYSVIVSGDIDPVVRSGDLVYAETLLGYASGELHYMVFRGGVPVDPAHY